MSDSQAPLLRYLRTPEAARYLGLSPRTLEKHRTYGTGPLFRRLGGRIVYAPEDLMAWAERGQRSSTTDPGKDTVPFAKLKIAPANSPPNSSAPKPPAPPSPTRPKR